MASHHKARSANTRKKKIMPGFNNEDEDDTFDQVAGMADRIGLEGEERQQYIHDHMTRLGYDPVQSRETYVKQQAPEEQQAASRPWWGGGGQRQQSGQRVQGSQGRSPQDEDRFGR